MNKVNESLVKSLIETLSYVLQTNNDSRIDVCKITMIQEKDHWDLKFSIQETPIKKEKDNEISILCGIAKS